MFALKAGRKRARRPKGWSASEERRKIVATVPGDFSHREFETLACEGPYKFEQWKQRFYRFESECLYFQRDIYWRISSAAGLCAWAQLVEWRASRKAMPEDFWNEADAVSQSDHDMATLLSEGGSGNRLLITATSFGSRGSRLTLRKTPNDGSGHT
jgi:hypothetical protein